MRSTESSAEAPGPSGRVDGDEHCAQVAGGQHHHRSAGAVETGLGGQVGEEFGVAGKGEARLVQGRLWRSDGGDNARDAAGEGQADATVFYPADHRRGVARWTACRTTTRSLQGQVEDGDGVGEDLGGLMRPRPRGERRLEPAPGGRRQQALCVADEAMNTGPLVAQRRPGLDRDFRSDPGGVAEA